MSSDSFARASVPADFLLSVVIPVYNERRWLTEQVRRVDAVPVPKEILLVDDGSTDGTREVLAEFESRPGVRVLYQPHNRGKGAALRVGFKHATGDVVIIQDADLEYNPADYPRLLVPILAGEADVVYGSRFLLGRPPGSPRWHAAVNRTLTRLSNLFTRLGLTDMETCYKAFRREALAGLNLTSDRFGFEPEVTAKLARGRWRVREVPISYAGRSYADGKKIRMRDGATAVYAIVRYAIAD
jgi:glycosyltransferase involved in cell wall biosynthesis